MRPDRDRGATGESSRGLAARGARLAAVVRAGGTGRALRRGTSGVVGGSDAARPASIAASGRVESGRAGGESAGDCPRMGGAEYGASDATGRVVVCRRAGSGPAARLARSQVPTEPASTVALTSAPRRRGRRGRSSPALELRSLAIGRSAAAYDESAATSSAMLAKRSAGRVASARMTMRSSSRGSAGRWRVKGRGFPRATSSTRPGRLSATKGRTPLSASYRITPHASTLVRADGPCFCTKVPLRGVRRELARRAASPTGRSARPEARAGDTLLVSHRATRREDLRALCSSAVRTVAGNHDAEHSPLP